MFKFDNKEIVTSWEEHMEEREFNESHVLEFGCVSGAWALL